MISSTHDSIDKQIYKSDPSWVTDLYVWHLISSDLFLLYKRLISYLNKYLMNYAWTPWVHYKKLKKENNQSIRSMIVETFGVSAIVEPSIKKNTS